MISVVINTLNEEKNLPRALTSIKNIADEIVVVDMKSDDKTQEIAKKAGAKVYEHDRVGYVEPARNFAIEKAKGEWVLILDADEEITNELASKLKDISEENIYDHVLIPRKNIVFGKWLQHSRWWPDYNIRFFKKGKVTWEDRIHSVPMTTGKGLEIPMEENLGIVHHNYDNIDQFIERLNRYTSKQAEGMKKDGYSFKWQDVIARPSSEFLSRYFFGRGYKDGIHGLALASLQAFSELVTYLKVWQIDKFPQEEISYKEVVDSMRKVNKEENYWYADTFVKEHGGFTEKVKRKLKLP